MKIVRPIALFFAAVALLAVVVAAIAIAPPFQTWYARVTLDEQPELRASLGSLSAAFGRVDIQGFKAETAGAVLTLPSAEVHVPLLRALVTKRVSIETLVAKGWTLDLSGVPEAAIEKQLESPGRDIETADPARIAETAIAGVLGGARLPFDVSVGRLELEGDLIIPQGAAQPARMHLVVDGGGLASGKKGEMQLTADLTPSVGAPSNLEGSLSIAMDTPRSVSAVGISLHLRRDQGPFSGGLSVEALAQRSGKAAGQTLALNLRRDDGRAVFGCEARLDNGAARITGSWRADVHTEDVAPFAPAFALPKGAVSGNGRFDADAGFSDIHVVGRLSATLRDLGLMSPALARFGADRFAADFDGELSARSLSMRRLDFSASGSGGELLVQLVQPCTFSVQSGAVSVADPASDLMALHVRSVPLSWLPDTPAGISFSSGMVSAEFALRAVKGGFVLSSPAPVVATHVSVEREGRRLVTGGGIVATAAAEWGDKGLEVRFSHAALQASGVRIGSLDLAATKPRGDNQPVSYSGTLQSGLPGDAGPKIPGLPWLLGRGITVSFSGSAGASPSLQAKFEVSGPAKGDRISGMVNADSDSPDSGEFLAPVKVESDGTSSALSLEGSWHAMDGETRTDIKVSSEHADMRNLLRFAPSAWSIDEGAKGGRDAPFWGHWDGQLAFDFDTLDAFGGAYEKVAGTLDFEPDSLELMGGRADIAPKVMASASGKVSFSPGSAPPYTLKGIVALSEKLDAAALIKPAPDESPVVEGHFSFSGTVSGSGASLAELSAHTTESFELASPNGIVRLLAVDVADAVPEAKERLSDSAAAVGNAVGEIFGGRGNAFDLAKNKLSRTADAVIGFTNQVSEIGYDKVVVKAERLGDGSIRLLNLEMISPDAHLTGTGLIGHLDHLPLSKQPLTLDLKLGVRRVSAKYLSEAGLLSAEKDALGYPLLDSPIHFGGSIDNLDKTQWHDLLASAIRRSAPKGRSAGR